MDEIRFGIDRSRSYPERLRYEQEPRISRSYESDLKARLEEVECQIEPQPRLSDDYDRFDRVDDYSARIDHEEFRAHFDEFKRFDPEPKIRLEPEGRSALDTESKMRCEIETKPRSEESRIRHDSDNRSNYDTARSRLDVETRSRYDQPETKTKYDQELRFDIDTKPDDRFDDTIIRFEPETRYRSDSDSRPKYDQPHRTRFELDLRPSRLDTTRQDTENNNRPLARSKSYYQPQRNDNLLNRYYSKTSPVETKTDFLRNLKRTQSTRVRSDRFNTTDNFDNKDYQDKDSPTEKDTDNEKDDSGDSQENEPRRNYREMNWRKSFRMRMKQEVDIPVLWKSKKDKDSDVRFPREEIHLNGWRRRTVKEKLFLDDDNGNWRRGKNQRDDIAAKIRAKSEGRDDIKVDSPFFRNKSEGRKNEPAWWQKVPSSSVVRPLGLPPTTAAWLTQNRSRPQTKYAKNIRNITSLSRPLLIG